MLSTVSFPLIFCILADLPIGTIGLKIKEKLANVDTIDVMSTENCSITVNQSAIHTFTFLIRKQRLKYISFYLKFPESNNVTYNNSVLLMPRQWIWTYRNKRGSLFKLMQYSFDFDILSFGLLNRHTKHFKNVPRESVNITVTPSDCSLELGNESTDALIGKGLQKLVSNTQYENDSMFCFKIVNDVREINGEFWWYITHFYGVARNYVSYRCCVVGKCDDRGEKITTTNYEILLQVYGVLLFIFSPIFLYKISDQIRMQDIENSGMWGFDSLAHEAPGNENVQAWIYKGDNIYFLTTFFNFLLCLRIKSRIAGILRRIIFIIAPASCLLLKAIVYYHYKYDDVKARLEHSVPVEQLCIPFGFTYCLYNSEYFLGGPMVYYPMYFVLGSLLLCIPDDLSTLLLSSKEFCSDYQNPVRTFLALTDGMLEERGLITKGYHIHGFIGLSRKILQRFCLLFRFTFWKWFLRTWKRRLCICCRTKVLGRRNRTSATKAALYLLSLVLRCLLCMFLAVLCFLEFIFVMLYYGLPAFFTLQLAISNYMKLVFEKVETLVRRRDSRRQQWCRLLLGGSCAVFVCLVLIFVLHMCAVFFVKSFTMVAFLVSYAFVGTLSYPVASGKYVLPAIVIIYYICQGYSAIIQDWRTTLSIVFRVSKELQSSSWRPDSSNLDEEEYHVEFIQEHPLTGIARIPKEVFEYVREETFPLRRQVLLTVVKLILTLNMVYIAIGIIDIFSDLGMYSKHDTLVLVARLTAAVAMFLLPRFLHLYSPNIRGKIAEENFEELAKLHIKKFWIRKYKLLVFEALA